jgi:diguanylate cyclase (GGDEF)-like protein
VTTVPKDRSLAQQLSRAFILFGALVAAAFLLTASTYGAAWGWLTPEVERSRLAVRAESAAYAAMIDEENGLRGYMMTRDPRFLEAYAGGEARLARANNALPEYAGSFPEVAVAMLGTRLAEERWRGQWAAAAADTRSGVVAPGMFEGEMLFDAYRTEERGFAEALNQRSDLLSRRDQEMTGSRVLLELGVFIAIFLLAVRQHRALRDSVVAPVAALLHHIGTVRDGELEAVVDPAGPRELRQLGEGLNDMVGALAVARKTAELRDDALRDHSVRLRKILDASREFSESLNLGYVVGAVQERTVSVGSCQRVIVWLMDDQQKRLVNAEGATSPASPDAPVDTGHGVAGRAAKSGRITFEGPDGEVRFGDGDKRPVLAIAIPLIVGARVVGALEARYAEATVATVQGVEILEMLATHAATAIESARLHEVVEERSQLDALTGLFNRRRLETDLDAECKRCARYGRPLAFVMLDVDHFKAFNDSHGHPQADTALQEVAGVIATCVRTTDTAYRYGGEEFCVLLRETNADDAMHFAERVRLRIERRFASGATPVITASFGVAEFSSATPMPRTLVEAADAAMYEAKHGGRNRVALSSAPSAIGLPGEKPASHVS